MDIGIRLQQLRETRGISAYSLSSLTGISETHIRNIERSRTQPTIYTLEKLLDALQVSLAEFFYEGQEIAYLTDHEKELLCYIRQLSSKKSEALLEFLKLLTAKNRPSHSR